MLLSKQHPKQMLPEIKLGLVEVCWDPAGHWLAIYIHIHVLQLSKTTDVRPWVVRWLTSSPSRLLNWSSWWRILQSFWTSFIDISLLVTLPASHFSFLWLCADQRHANVVSSASIRTSRWKSKSNPLEPDCFFVFKRNGFVFAFHWLHETKWGEILTKLVIRVSFMSHFANGITKTLNTFKHAGKEPSSGWCDTFFLEDAALEISCRWNRGCSRLWASWPPYFTEAFITRLKSNIWLDRNSTIRLISIRFCCILDWMFSV